MRAALPVGAMRALTALVVLASIAPGCGDDAGPPTTSATTTTPATTTPAATAPTAPTPSTTAAGPAFEVAEGWTALGLGRGIKPDLALDADGEPGVAWVLEALDGYIAYADRTSGWSQEDAVVGYFYGPITLAYRDGEPVIAYHDHQDQSFNQDLGDLTLALRRAGEWTVETARDDGHDGWDAAVAVAPDGTLHAAGIDPVQFDREDGIEHYERIGDGWVVTPIGAPLIEYAWNVSLAVNAEGDPSMSFHDTKTLDLVYAERIDGEWVLTTVDADGDVGAFSSLVLGPNGTPHISYTAYFGADRPLELRYATRTEAGWAVELVALLDSVDLGHFGARRITDVALDPEGSPIVAAGSTAVVGLATRDTGGWSIEEVARAGENRFGQLVTVAVDADGVVHLAFTEVTSPPGSDLDGTVWYLWR